MYIGQGFHHISGQIEPLRDVMSWTVLDRNTGPQIYDYSIGYDSLKADKTISAIF